MSHLVQAGDDQQLLLLVQLFSDIFMLALHRKWGGHRTACRDPVSPNNPVAPGSKPVETLMGKAGGENRGSDTCSPLIRCVTLEWKRSAEWGAYPERRRKPLVKGV